MPLEQPVIRMVFCISPGTLLLAPLVRRAAYQRLVTWAELDRGVTLVMRRNRERAELRTVVEGHHDRVAAAQPEREQPDGRPLVVRSSEASACSGFVTFSGLPPTSKVIPLTSATICGWRLQSPPGAYRPICCPVPGDRSVRRRVLRSSSRAQQMRTPSTGHVTFDVKSFWFPLVSTQDVRQRATGRSPGCCDGVEPDYTPEAERRATVRGRGGELPGGSGRTCRRSGWRQARPPAASLWLCNNSPC